MRRKLDGWLEISSHNPFYTIDGFSDRPEIDFELLRSLMYQIGVIDTRRLFLGLGDVNLPDVNRLGEKAGCGTEYWLYEWECYRFLDSARGLMSGDQIRIGSHTAGGLRSNFGHRRGYDGEYLFDTPRQNVITINDSAGNALPDVKLRLFQFDERQYDGVFYPSHIVDEVPEFTLTTDINGSVVLPNHGITGQLTATGHQLRPNPFGVIDATGYNGVFIIEMTSDQCTNYEWLSIIELNLAFWEGNTEEAVFEKTLRCPPP